MLARQVSMRAASPSTPGGTRQRTSVTRLGKMYARSSVYYGTAISRPPTSISEGSWGRLTRARASWRDALLTSQRQILRKIVRVVDEHIVLATAASLLVGVPTIFPPNFPAKQEEK